MAVQVFSSVAPQSGTDTIVPYTWGVGSADFVVCSVFCDQAGTLFIEQSGDNTNWDISEQVSVTASTGTFLKVDAKLAFARARMHVTVNSSVFRLYLRTTSAGARP